MPAIIAWPGQIAEDESRDQVVHACDWLPTLAELTGVRLPPRELDGRSVVAVLRDGKVASPHELEALHWQVGEGATADWAVRLGDWKLIGRSRDTSVGDVKGKVVEDFLVDLRSDPAEQTNLAEAEPETVRRLRRLHEEELR